MHGYGLIKLKFTNKCKSANTVLFILNLPMNGKVKLTLLFYLIEQLIFKNGFIFIYFNNEWNCRCNYGRVFTNFRLHSLLYLR